MILCRSAVIICQLNLHDSTPMMNNNVLQFDCLYYYVQNGTVIYQELANIIDELIQYCFRPINENSMPFGNFIRTNGEILSYEELYLANITVQQLLSWSTPIDLAERYQFYLNELNSSLNERFYNCTRPWFGDRCQYSFHSSENTFIAQIVQSQFHRRLAYSKSSHIVAQLPCYIHMHCDRGGASLCLDWREVCDGHVDCLGLAEDEAQCYEMELNECEDDEFRCHNGLCIPEVLWENGLGDADCLDRSDELVGDYIGFCFQDPSFRCEEHMCRPNWIHFTCGDGQCVDKFADCNNGRHSSLISSVSAKGNLSEKCWIAMSCLTKLVRRINGTSCETWMMNNLLLEFLNDCAPIFQFPIIPIHFGHIRFVYVSSHLKQDINKDFVPDYVCYDEQLCDCLVANFSYENQSCLRSAELPEKTTYTPHPWINMILWIDAFFRRCSITYQMSDTTNSSSLYFCKNSLKSISKHRILDQINDCNSSDDENPLLSCSINDKYRVDCLNGEHCLSPLLSKADCPLPWNYDQEKLPFEQICDGKPSSQANAENYTDESDCESWPCDNMYTRCDSFWTCSDGRDEVNCGHPWCSPDAFACISPINYTLLCLPGERVRDTVADCLGALDELIFCLVASPSGVDPVHFRCSNSSICLPVSKLCDGTIDCDFSNDDEQSCTGHRINCDEKLIGSRSFAEDFFCQLNENSRSRYFSVHTSINYPSWESSVHDKLDHWPKESHVNINEIQSWSDNYPWPWLCNRGLLVHVTFDNSSIKNRCLCPPSYYGDFCQYQNQRVSMTLRLTAINRYASYALVLMLIDDNDEEQQIESYDQSVYIVKHSCSLKLNRYLLYSTRPKNTLKNYSVRLHVFDKNQIMYIGSWHFNISFLFLPVNRLVASVLIPNTQAPLSSNCERHCQHGICVQYLNKKKSFCQCFPSWSGTSCHIRINCEGCSKDSVCVGTANNRPICVCPLTKFGPRCLLTASCPSTACLNSGQCVPADVSIAGSNYRCVCSEQFFGSRCENMRIKLDVSLNKLDSPPYIVAYFVSTSNESKPTSTIILRKLTLFQRIVTFHISIPYNMVLVKVKETFYLVVVQQTSRMEISTSIDSNRECFPIESLFNSSLVTMIRYRRVKFYHSLCQNDPNLHCFMDEVYLCLCTNERHANCMDFNRHENLQCLEKTWCENGVECLEDHPSCPSTRICVCQDCFFGDRCQYYAKGFGLTLDEILGYEIKRNTNILRQPLSVQLSGIVTMIMFLIGLVNGILVMFVFADKNAQEVGCGLYLLASSVTSLVVVMLFTVKFWILFLSHLDLSIRRYLVIISGFGIEIPLKIFLYTDNWLNAFVAIERVYAVAMGMSFNKQRTKQVAKYVIYCLPITITALMTPQLINLVVFDDEKEDRTWCVMRYGAWLETYNLMMISFHFIAPLVINQLSSVFIIINTARQRATTHKDRHCFEHLTTKLKQYKHLLLSPLMLVTLSSLHVGITLSMDCKKSSHRFWFHLLGYFLSFTPSILVFIIFVLPSRTYRKIFKDAIVRFRRRFPSLER